MQLYRQDEETNKFLNMQRLFLACSLPGYYLKILFRSLKKSGAFLSVKAHVPQTSNCLCDSERYLGAEL